ncbi:erythrocyte membrane protein 1, EMP1, putative [Plasmodium sp. gorilla clade G3]|nr:erythrocyte membrane protein 1, EMP1, putative [Plasmodium sp. gorilla clade G3]
MASTNKTVTEIAQYIQKDAEKRLEGNGSRSSLKAHPKQGKYTNSGEGTNLNPDFCNIDKRYSNANSSSKDPCKGKGGDQRFAVGTKWETDKNLKDGYKDVLLPPRRKLMCTTNLENLDTRNTGPLGSTSSNINNSFLGDVLLAANKEAQNITQHHPGVASKDQSAVCRAVRRSFADIADIIRGTDIWSKQHDQKNLQRHLEKIFKNIKDKLFSGSTTYTHPNHLKLREDWWEANREDVWKAMKCHIQNYIVAPEIKISQGEISGSPSGYCGYPDNPPYDDYIPQLLRWITEWAENYCIQVKSLYKGVTTECKPCQNGANKQCTRENENCDKCSAKCKEYRNNVKEWKKQWKDLIKQYDELYRKGTEASSSTPSDEIEEKLKEFFEKLKTVTTRKNYETLAEYITQTRANTDCVDAKQSKFYDKDKNEKEYAFRKYPYTYDTACKCKEEPCDIMDTLIEKNNGTTTIDEIENCKSKDKDTPYPVWNCDENGTLMKVGVKGACMPPRRKKLCIYNLSKTYETNTNTKDDLRKSFIKCAAKETFFAWDKYKKDKEKENSNGGETATELDNKLKCGIIPEDFKRIMFYTYGDYRDICLGNDLGNDEAKDISSTVTKILKEESSNQYGGQLKDREEWWNSVKTDVWKGMLCALSHHIKIDGDEEEDKKRENLTDKEEYQYNYKKEGPNSEITMRLVDVELKHQFLRWFTEWSEEFCRERNKKMKTLREKCPSSKCNESDKRGCKNACETYKSLINQWKTQYTSQSTNFDKYKLQKEVQNEYNGIQNKKAYEYLRDQLKTLGVKDDSNCMKNDSKAPKLPGSGNIPASFDPLPSDYVQQCDCALKDAPCTIVETKLKDKNGTIAIDKCEPKKDLFEWKCDKHEIKKLQEGPCMPPRRKKLCIHNLKVLKNVDKKDKLKDELIKCAAIETFFSWLYYKRKNGIGADQKLQEGKIPDDFKRQMFYTYSDYRDICLGKDIGNDEANVVPRKVNNILSAQNVIQIDDARRKKWWDGIKSDVWDAMICGLSHASDKEKDTARTQLIDPSNENTYETVTFNGSTKLSQFVDIPQFLRWMIEWSEDFCKQQKDKYNKVKKNCGECSDEKCEKKDECEKCKQTCTEYQTFITKCKDQWKTQEKKYAELHTKAKNGEGDTTEHVQRVVNHLNDLLTSGNPYGTAGEYVKEKGYIRDCGQQNEFSYIGEDKYAFREYPQEYNEQCNCETVATKPEVPRPQAAKPAATKPSSESQGTEEPPSGESGQHEDNGGAGGKLFDQIKKDVYTFSGAAQFFGVYGAIEAIHYAAKIAKGVLNELGVGKTANGAQDIPDAEDAPTEAGADEAVTQPDNRGDIHQTSIVDSDSSESRVTGSPGGQVSHGDSSNSSSSSSTSSSSLSSSTERNSQESSLGDVTQLRRQKGESEPTEPGGQESVTKSHPLPSLPITVSNILSYGYPLKIGLALISIAFYFYVKKKPQIKTTRSSLFRVIDILKKSKYRIHDKSPKRYVSYRSDDVYKGRTYIYMEGEETDDYSYVRDIYLSDITSSESEYEQMDVNDIYMPHRAPKYKTLIEIILEPNKRDNTFKTHISQEDTHDTSDTQHIHNTYADDMKDIYDTHTYDVKYTHISHDNHVDNMKDTSDTCITHDTRHTHDDTNNTPTNKFTDNEWNQLKHEFISQYLNHIGPDVPLNNELPTDDIPKDTQPDDNLLYFDNHDEKPFITQIKDRDLYDGEQITYDINWNTTESTNITNNNHKDDKKNTSDNLYSGIDLINDSLNCYNNVVNIYDQLLKRKENELIITNNVKRISILYGFGNMSNDYSY